MFISGAGRASPPRLAIAPAMVDRMMGLVASVLATLPGSTLPSLHHDSARMEITLTAGRHRARASITSEAVCGGKNSVETAMPK